MTIKAHACADASVVSGTYKFVFTQLSNPCMAIKNQTIC